MLLSKLCNVLRALFSGCTECMVGRTEADGYLVFNKSNAFGEGDHGTFSNVVQTLYLTTEMITVILKGEHKQ